MIILGSTGSIGRNALEIVARHNLRIEMLGAGENIELLNAQIARFKPNFIAIKNPNDIHKVQKPSHTRLFCAESGILEALECTTSKLVLNAMVGISGLKPSIKALNLGKKLALANKETLVVAGEFIDTSNIIPVDSEHFALHELLCNRNAKKLIITASGGALRDCPLDKLANQSAKSALNHPNWAMGKKITIDSATMINKLFEILEAKWLFKNDNIDAMIERNSIIHAFIQTHDNAIFAHCGIADMKLPISYALLGEKALKMPHINEIDLCNYNFHFEKIDSQRYPLWNLKNAILHNPKLGIIINAANEILVEQFLNNNISFGDIEKGIYKAITTFEKETNAIKNIDDVIYFDEKIRTIINNY